MRHERHYTLEEASELLPWLQEQLDRLREARERFTDAATREALSDAAPTNGGGEPGRQVGYAFFELRDVLAAITEREIVLRDLETGLLDFPAIRDGREVYLCWIEGEEEIGHWHDLDAGYGGREPL